MELAKEAELSAHLIQTDGEFRTLHEQHHEYDEKLVQLEAKSHLTDEEQLEEVRLKKLKLHAKDLMREILSRYKEAQVS